VEDRDKKMCIVCNTLQSSGIMIVGSFICQFCEAEMVKTDVKDEKYPFFVQRMRRIWIKQDA